MTRRAKLVTENLKDWWQKALLTTEALAHPVLGHRIKVDIDDGVVTLRGKVESSDEAEELEEEVRRVAGVSDVINHLRVSEPDDDYHLQTVIAIFPDKEKAKLALGAAESWTFHADYKAELLDSVPKVRNRLEARVRAARAPKETLERYAKAVAKGKVLFMDRVREDDAFRVISELEGMPTQDVLTLPPEPR